MPQNSFVLDTDVLGFGSTPTIVKRDTISGSKTSRARGPMLSLKDE